VIRQPGDPQVWWNTGNLWQIYGIRGEADEGGKKKNKMQKTKKRPEAMGEGVLRAKSIQKKGIFGHFMY
jgi:hypothetical protein